ncbi:hypothetical protein SAMN05192561_10774 [Halopenitus malekzadehii]|uniref:Uncharacterized protein n=1 Tax=Halopenitus malekzadehii TaxID=1267564 RepID=A0A1H6J9S8_9EURY|nr:ATP-binding protein [Halopenitus malekzadehii]SEH56396.1 hypothetical protein SAMN05192561_10774 [Halopenitus malekzadehii]
MSTIQEDTELQCPHFEAVDEKTLRQLFSKVAAVRSDNKDLFEYTHRPIKVFRSPQGTRSEEEVVGEEEVYREFTDQRVGNFSVVIEGEVGTGKSELCAFLSHQLEQDGRPILHVDKDDDLMTLLSERIPEFYEKHFNEELPGASNFQQLREDLKKNGSVVANNATSGAILNLSARGNEVDAEGKEEKIREFVQDQLSLLVEKGEYAKEIKFVTEQAYRRNDFLQVIEDSIDVEDAVEAFNEELWREIRERYQTASLGDVLERVGDRFTDTRPVIIFEDFAITAMEGKRLRNYMERDKPSDNWDFVVAGTRDSTDVLHTQTAEDRFEFYRTNRQNSNSVLFLDEDSAVGFIRPYLGYFKSFDGSVEYDRSGDGLDLSLNPAPSESICADCGFCDESFRDLFPFNEPFLERVYAGLQDDEQSPREYVMAVFDVLRDYYEGYIDAPSSADRLAVLTNKVDPATPIYESAESLANLARWYGVPTADGIEVDARFISAFGESKAVEETDGVTRSDGIVTIPTDLGSTDPPGPKPTGPKPPDPPKPSKAERLIQDLQPNVQPWQSNPGEFSDITRYLRIGLRAAIKHLTDDFELFDGMGLRYNLSSQKDPFVFRSQQQSPDQNQIVIDPQEFRLSDLKNLLEFGIYREEKRSQADFDELLRGLGTQLTGYARQWQQEIIEQDLRSDLKFFKKNAGHKFEDFALAGYAYVVLLSSPFEEVTAERLSGRFSKSGSYTLDSELREALKQELSTDGFNNLVKFMNQADRFEEMVSAFFGANANTLDVARVRERLEEHPPTAVFEGLGRGRIQRVSSRVRFDTDSKIRDIADVSYDLNRVFEELEDEYRENTITTISDELASVSISNITSILETLRTYDHVDTDMVESLGKFVALDQQAIDEAADAARLASDLENRSDDEQLQAILISLKLTTTNVYKRYNNISIVGGGTGPDFAKNFLEIGGYYVD